ncbi:strain BS90 toll-like receptor [Biomphalaria pfeifferi]|uniref:Strain BS90 toll-like receptor n=1 Tax=Biomphalaria pfeifferi TaxID=112525 RepID=A0AAD8ARM7_BIOPF|nr:strain BS90 toll-like receptor [Biomphalaria pfeifferi]
MAAGVSVGHVTGCQLYILAVCLTLGLQLADSLELLQNVPTTTYEPFNCPLECNCPRSNSTLSSLPQYYTICTVSLVSPNNAAVRSILQSISTPKTAVLYMTCSYSQINLYEEPPVSELWDGAFEAMTSLRQLTFTKCAFQKLTRGAFEGLTYLKKLSVQYANIKELDANLLSNMQLLETLEISHSSLRNLFSLCSYTSLKNLNLSFNHLANLEDLGINCGGKSLHNLESLDMRNNLLTEIPNWLSENLLNLHYLYLSGNLIENYDHLPLKNFSSLYLMDLSNNSLTEIKKDFLSGCDNLQYLYMSRNPIIYIQRQFLKAVSNLVELEMVESRLSDSIWLEISDISKRLRILNLSRNRLTKINENTMSDLRLEVLNVSYNRIVGLNSNAFGSQTNLITLDLSYNLITDVPVRFSQNMTNLVHLLLNNNNIKVVQSEAFMGLGKLESLDLSFNSLQELMPQVVGALEHVVNMNLSYNHLRVLNSDLFLKFKQMKHLNVSHNALQELPFLYGNVALQDLDASFNNITKVIAQTFQDLKELQTISLSHNLLSSLPFRMFKGCENVKTIYLSFNLLSHLDDDFFTSSPRLTFIDLSHNKMTAMNNIFRYLNHLKFLQLSYNKITTLLRNQLPRSLETLDISNNNIHQISSHTFKTLSNLRYVDLSVNNLTTLSQDEVEIAYNLLSRPTFNLVYNPLVCDCKLEWLKDWYDGKFKDTGTLPTFQTTLTYGCISPLYSTKMPITSLRSDEFLCHYEKHCDKTCVCCDYDVCHCKYTCPSSCQCYIGDKFLNIHQVHCFNANLTDVPGKIPEGATLLRLDGNNLPSLREHSFLGLTHVMDLYLNNSHIHTVENNTFKGMKSVRSLYLNNNLLTIISPGVFSGLENLERIFLQNNFISLIDPQALLLPPYLYLINLRENDLNTLPIDGLWGFVNRSRESGLKVRFSLSQNPYSCQLDFVCKFVLFIRDSADCIEDISDIKCSSNSLGQQSYYQDGFTLLDFQIELCSENQSFPTNMSRNSVHSSSAKGETYALIAACVVIAFGLALLIVAYMNRDFLQVLCFTRFGLRVFKMAKAADDNDRPYDAFISYSSKDEDFVIHQLAPRLENGDKKFQLCVHYRDFPVGACIAETIVRSVEASKRTILVVSDNFLDSEWCRFEFQTAHQQVLNERRNRVILILMHDLDTEKLDSTLKVYMRTRTYLKYDDPWFWEKLMFAMPDVQHRKPPENIPCHMNGNMQYMPQNVTLQHPHRRVPTSCNGVRCETIHNDMYEIPILDSGSVHYQLANGRCCCTHTNSAYHNSDLSDSTSGFHNGSVSSYGHYEEVGPSSSSMQSTPHKFVGTPPPVPSIPKEGFLPIGRVKTAYV